MVYVQYYEKRFNRSLNCQEYQEPCGDRAVVIIDGRNTLENMIADAHKFNGRNRPVYDAFRIFKGRSFMDSQPISSIIKF